MNSSEYKITDSDGRHVQVQVVKLTEQLQAQRDLFDLLIIGEPNCSQQGLDKLNESKKEQGYKSNLQQVLQKFVDKKWSLNFKITKDHVTEILYKEDEPAKASAASGIEIGQDECWMSSAHRYPVSYEGMSILDVINKCLLKEKQVTDFELINTANSSVSNYDSCRTFLKLFDTPKMTAGLEGLKMEG